MQTRSHSAATATVTQINKVLKTTKEVSGGKIRKIQKRTVFTASGASATPNEPALSKLTNGISSAGEGGHLLEVT